LPLLLLLLLLLLLPVNCSCCHCCCLCNENFYNAICRLLKNSSHTQTQGESTPAPWNMQSSSFILIKRLCAVVWVVRGRWKRSERDGLNRAPGWRSVFFFGHPNWPGSRNSLKNTAGTWMKSLKKQLLIIFKNNTNYLASLRFNLFRLN